MTEAIHISPVRQPRHEKVPLTEAQIEYMVSGIIVPKFPLSEVDRLSVQQQLRDHVAAQLREVLIYEDDEEAIEKLHDSITAHYERSIIIPSTPIGNHTAEAIMAPISQLVLKAYHPSETKRNTSEGIERVRELIFFRKTISAPSMDVIWNKRLTFKQALNKRADIVHIDVLKILKDPSSFEVMDSRDEEIPVWYSIFKDVYPRRRSYNSLYFLRLEFNIRALFIYKLTLKKIADIIEEKTYYSCIFSPQHIGVIDVYVDDNSNEVLKFNRHAKLEQEQAQIAMSDMRSFYFFMATIPEFLKYYIQGIENVTSLYVYQVEVQRFISSETKINATQWLLTLDERYMSMFNYSIRELVAFMSKCGIQYMRTGGEYELVVSASSSPFGLIKETINQEKERYSLDVELRGSVGMGLSDLVYPPLLDEANYVYCATDGTNLRELFKRSDVDRNHSFTNDVHEIYSMFGIEAVYDYLIDEFHRVTVESSYINNRHILLLCAFMTSNGMLTPLDKRGVSIFAVNTETGEDEDEDVAEDVEDEGLQAETLTGMGNERVMDSISKDAMFGTYEGMISKSAGVMTGSLIQHGFTIATTPKVEEEIKMSHMRHGLNSRIKQLTLEEEEVDEDMVDINSFGIGLKKLGEQAPKKIKPIPVNFRSHLRMITTTEIPVETIPLNDMCLHRPTPAYKPSNPWNTNEVIIPRKADITGLLARC